MNRGPGTNTGHGHVWKRPDGMLARCGGPGMCRDCSADQAQFRAGTIVKAPLDLQALLATMQSAKEQGVGMAIWDRDIKTVQDAIATIEAIRAVSTQKEPS